MDDSLQTQKVVFHFKDATFAIPRNYLIAGSDETKKDNPRAFILRALLPDLDPINNNNSEKFSKLGLGDKVQILVSDESQLVTRDYYFDELLQGDDKERVILKKFSNGIDLYRIHNALWQDVYVKRNNNGSIVFLMTCDFDYSASPEKICTVFAQITKNTSINYFFSKKYVESGVDIDSKIINLIYSFQK